MHHYKYSIIIPHFNIPHLLMRCLKSIPVDDTIQVIVVDDCSPDGETYLSRFPELSRPHLELYKTPQGGSAGRARNVGLDHAKGDWVIFIDADDLFSDHLLELLNQSVDEAYDILHFYSESVMSDDLSQPADRNYYNELLDAYPQAGSELRLRYDFQSLWGKVFKRDFIEAHHIRCDETKYSNDVFFSFMAGHFAEKITVVNQILYYVTQREGSLASSQFTHQTMSLTECETRLGVSLKIVELTRQYNIPFKGTLHIELSRELRQNYPAQYAKLLGKLLWRNPAIALEFIQRDGKTIVSCIKRLFRFS